MAMTAEEKAERAAKMRAARAAKKEAEQQEEIKVQEMQPSSEDGESIEALKKMVEQLKNELQTRPTQVINMVSDTEKITMRFQAEVSDDNTAVFGPNGMYGQVTGKVGMITVPKSEWSRFYNDSVRRMIENRWLVVLTGMDDDERRIYHCDYQEGELLDDKAFYKLLDMGEELLEIFPQLCTQHQEMVGRRFLDAWEKGDARTQNRELIVKLNDMSKKSYQTVSDKDVRKKGIFFPIIEAMNAKDAQ